MTIYLTIQENVPNATQLAEAAWTNYLNLPEFNNFNPTKRILMAFEINYNEWKKTPLKNVAIWNSILQTIQSETPSIYGTTLRVLYETMEHSTYNLDTLRRIIYTAKEQVLLEVINYKMPKEIKSLVGEATPELINDVIGTDSSDKCLCVLNNNRLQVTHLQTNPELNLLFQHAYNTLNIERVLKIPETEQYYAYDILYNQHHINDYLNLFTTKKDQLNFVISTIEILTKYTKNPDDDTSTEVLTAINKVNTLIHETFEKLYPAQYQLYKTLKAIDAYDYMQLTNIIQNYITTPIESYPLPLM